MRRQRALALAVVLALVVAVQFALPTQLSMLVATALAQDEPVADAGEPADLAVVALHCAQAPSAEELTSYFATGAPPALCAPAVGVAIDVAVDETPLSGSPFATDVAGSLVIPVALGSSLVVTEDPESLPAGYEPLAVEANGVPYANPVRLDSAVTGAAVLFVNVPSAVGAALAQEAAASTRDEAALEPALGTADCDLARTDERNLTLLAPDPGERGPSGTTVAADFSPPAGGTAVASPNSALNASGGSARGVTSSRVANLAVATYPARRSTGVWSWQSRNRDDGWLWHADRNRAGLWLWPGRVGSGNFAAASSSNRNFAFSGTLVSTGAGIWQWPLDRDRFHDWRVQDKGLWIWSGAVAGSRSGNLAVSGSFVRIGAGLWFWPPDRHHADVWRWPVHNRLDNWFVHGDGVWLWPGRIGIGNLTAARSSSGSLAVVANIVRIGHGVWFVPHDRNDHGVWIWSGAIARSSSGNLAVSGSAVRIGTGVWMRPHDHDRGHDWLAHDPPARVQGSSAQSLEIGESTVAEAPSKIEQPDSSQEPAPASDDGLAIETSSVDAVQPPADAPDPLPAESVQPASDGSIQPAVDAYQPAGDGSVETAPEAVESAPGVDPDDVDPASVAPAAEPAPDVVVQQQPASAAPDPAYVVPDLSYVEPAAEPVVDPGYVAPEPSYSEPSVVAPSDGGAGYVEATVWEPVADPVYVEPAADPGFVAAAADPAFGDPGLNDAANFTPDLGFADPGNDLPDLGFADSGVDASFVAPDLGNNGPDIFAPDPISVDPGGGGPGLGDFGNAAPAPNFGDPGNAGNGGADFVEVNAISAAPSPDVGGFEGDQENE